MDEITITQQEIDYLINKLKSAEKGAYDVRALALVITKLEEAQMWSDKLTNHLHTLETK